MFKKYIAQDITKTFINENEFGELASVNGISVKIVQDDDRLSFRIKKDYDGLVVGDVLFYITEEEWRKLPRVSKTPRAGEAILFKGKPSTITSVLVETGVYEVVIQYNGG